MKPASRAFFKSALSAPRRVATNSCLLVAVFFGLAITVEAHDPGLSAAELRIEGRRVAAHVTFARSDLEKISTAPQTLIAEERFAKLAEVAFAVEIGGSRIAPRSSAAEIDDANGSVHFSVEYFIESAARVRLSSPLIGVLPRGHRQYIAINDADGNLVDERMLDAANDGIEIDVAGSAVGNRPQSFRQFLVLGVEHILTGYDHLVFLLGLMIAGASFRAAAKIITSFTVAHSITLALATLDMVRISPGVVEPLIAASIVYVGVENIFRRDLNRRWLLTFGFGLAHGFGFASVLKELGIGAGGVSAAVPLVSFNLGVEMGQIAIASLALPIIWKLRDRPAFAARYAPACSALISLTGAIWFIERTLLK